MTEHPTRGHALLCYDGSDDAGNAIASAASLLGPQSATVLTVREPVELWEPWDPATVLDAGLAKLTPMAGELTAIADEMAEEQLLRGVRLANEAGFEARGRIARGKPWRAICEVATELDVSVIVLGARGRSAIRSALLGSVSAAVSTHTTRPVLIVHATGANGAPETSSKD